MFEVLLDLGPDIKPRAAVGDKGYANRKNRAAARDRAICPVIPYKAKEKNPPRFFAKVLYRARARIEQLVGKLKRFKRIALRCEKTARNFGSFVALVLGLILVKSVHTTYQMLLLVGSALHHALDLTHLVVSGAHQILVGQGGNRHLLHGCRRLGAGAAAEG